ncbi:helix-turn-helix transcriptional regulator [Streptomyces iconiensis]|uniref:AraC family transcriptional regulator n=1 Tax=Streptomyces iconiensis TaxID=1384038 RepID=A0ABT6ZUM9_9ACTN|nr:AraC family transcriptional regulator [Streptomyces iconiensis]MDJ1132766.1 AraC family transcriptional regulator [Streptomyces iconiensis]
MNRNGQALAEVGLPFPATPGGPPGLEIHDVPGWSARLRRLAGRAEARVRPDFHVVIHVRTGRLPCSVDFTDCVVESGCWLWVRPGQLLQLRTEPGSVPGTAAQGTVVLFRPSILDAATVATARLDRRAWRLPLAPAPPAGEPLRQTLEMLENEYHHLRDLPLEAHVAVARHLLAVLVLRLSSLSGGRRTPMGDATFQRFQEAVEEDFTRTHRVEDYAARLGYSVRTLTRATNAAVGCGAKSFLDDRLMLEAKRLLLHTELPATAVGERLGFHHATVFTKFFRHHAGETPAAFRARSGGTPA